MSFRKWLFGLLGSQQKSQSEQALAPPPAGHSLEEEVAGLNFRTAIEAHQKWKVRLQAVIDGDTSETLSVEEVSRDDCCVLGKWIHGAGKQKFGQNELFESLQTNHAHFHICAGKVLETALTGNKAAAQAALGSGDFPQASQVIVMTLAQMYTKVAN